MCIYVYICMCMCVCVCEYVLIITLLTEAVFRARLPTTAEGGINYFTFQVSMFFCSLIPL